MEEDAVDTNNNPSRQGNSYPVYLEQHNLQHLSLQENPMPQQLQAQVIQVQQPMIHAYQPGPMAHQQYVAPPTAPEFAEDSFWEKDGLVLIFQCTNIGNASVYMGATRTNVKDAARIPNYLMRNKAAIKMKAIELFKTHRIQTQWGVAADEKMSVDDFGISFMAASLTQEAYKANANRRNEGPILMYFVPHFLREWVFTGTPRPDGTPNRGHVVNVYLTCNSKGTRYNAVVEAGAKKAEEEELQRADPSYRGGKRPNLEMRELFRLKREREAEQERELKEGLLRSQQKVLDRLDRVEAAAVHINNPALPRTAPQWVPTSTIRLPDDDE